MAPKVFTTEARAAIDAQHGALFDAILSVFIAGNPSANSKDGPELIKAFANPLSVYAVYRLYSLRLPTHVSVNGHQIRILGPNKVVEEKAEAFRSFNLVFGGIQGWLEHRQKYEQMGNSHEHLERLAVRWLEGDWHNAEFFSECKRVPGFERQLAAVTISEDGQPPSDEDLLHLAGYKQLKAQYEREGGNPDDMDEAMLSFLGGDESYASKRPDNYMAALKRDFGRIIEGLKFNPIRAIALASLWLGPLIVVNGLLREGFQLDRAAKQAIWRTWPQTVASLDEIQKTPNSAADNGYSAVVVLEVNGFRHRERRDIGMSALENDTITVAYNPKDIRQFVFVSDLNSTAKDFIAPILTVLFGLILSAFGIWLIRRNRAK